MWFIAALLTIAKIWKQPKCPSADEWIKKMYNVMLPGHKKNEILPSATTWMDPEGIRFSEVSQMEKGKYCMFSLICGIQIISVKQTND